MRKQDVVLKDQPDVTLLGRHAQPCRRVFEDFAGEFDAPDNLDEP